MEFCICSDVLSWQLVMTKREPNSYKNIIILQSLYKCFTVEQNSGTGNKIKRIICGY